MDLVPCSVRELQTWLYVTNDDKPLSRISGIARWDSFPNGGSAMKLEHNQRESIMADEDPVWPMKLDTRRCAIYRVPVYAVHPNCLELLKRHLSGLSMRDNLCLLIDISREYYRENPHGIHEVKKYENREKWNIPTERGPTPKAEYVTWDELDLGDGRTQQVINLRDPLRIPEIPKLVELSIQSRARQNMRRKTRWSTISQANEGQARSSQFQQIAQLPVDAVFLVLDKLLRSVDIRNALIAFNWTIPEPYWKSRIPKDLFFELENVAPDDMDWRFFYLHANEMQTFPALKNRRRVLDVLAEVKKRFLVRQNTVN